MKILFIVLILSLTACVGVTNLIDIPANARQAYDDAFGTSIVLTETDAIDPITGAIIPIDPITVTPIVNATATGFIIDINNGECAITYDLSNTPDFAFWLTQPITLTYNNNVTYCGTITSCDYVAEMVGTVAEVAFSCTVQ